MSRLIALLLVILLPIAAPASGQSGAGLAQAMDQLRAGNWGAALRAAKPDGQIATDIVEWHRLRAGQGTLDEVNAFLDRRGDWPGLAWLRRKSEPATALGNTNEILDFYAESPPQTAEGVLVHARALIQSQRQGEAEAALVLAWRTLPMGRTSHQTFLTRHGTLLGPHHVARLDRMLWERHMDSAGRMLSLVSDDQRALAQARIALYELAPGVDARIEAVPEALRDTAGLAHARFEWRMRKSRTEDALSLLMARSEGAQALGEPEKWAKRRRSLTRQLMRAGEYRDAYRIAAAHFLTDGSDFADLEWLAGFIALRFLKDPATASRHFQRFDGAVLSPISKGRAGYWLGRAHEALGESEAAQAAYTAGAQHQTAFYGLLAADRAGLPFDPALANPDVPPPWREADFMQSSVLQAGLLLISAGEPVLAERFLTHLAEGLDATSATQLGQMALDMDRPHLAVMIAKRTAQQGLVLPAAYYPLHPLGQMELPMAPEMTLAIARRESEFDPVVVSGAGARGLMQVMPATARSVARDMGVLGGHSDARLLSDWRYNARLGARYLAGLAGDFDGNVVMMSAGYNAGPGRPMSWMARNGDPRRANGPDMVDWIELIPFNETRNYVMRVTESLPIYRARLGKDPLPVRFSEELTGSTLRMFAP